MSKLLECNKFYLSYPFPRNPERFADLFKRLFLFRNAVALKAEMASDYILLALGQVVVDDLFEASMRLLHRRQIHRVDLSHILIEL